MPISIPKKPQYDTKVSGVDIDNGGQPPAEDVKPSFDTKVAGIDMAPRYDTKVDSIDIDRGSQPVWGLPGNPYTDHEAEVMAYDKPVEPDPYGQALVDFGGSGLMGIARGLLKGGAQMAPKAMAAVEKMVTERAGAEGLTGLRAVQQAVKSGEAAPESLAQYAQKLLGNKKPGLGYARRPAWEEADAAAKRTYRLKPLEGDAPAEQMGFGSFEGKPTPDLATNAVSKKLAPPSNGVDEFFNMGHDWLTNVFPKTVK
jgi:hypothetical protein